MRERLAQQLGVRADPVESIDALQARLQGGPTVVILGPSCARPDVLADLARTLQAHREVGTVLISDELSTDLLQTALRSGVNDVLGAGGCRAAGGRRQPGGRRPRDGRLHPAR